MQGNPVRWSDATGLDRFLGEDVACEYLKKHNGNANEAWWDIRAHRYTYKGLREYDRNAEHYLYNLFTVREDRYSYFIAHGLNLGYSGVKKISNTLGFDKFQGTPPTNNELNAGFFGAQDGMFGSEECEKLCKN